VIATLQLPHTFLLPQAWQRVVGVGPAPDQARQRAAQLYPGAAERLTRKRDGGRADALLIATAGWRMLNLTQEAA
jgi:hypothetical protein